MTDATRREGASLLSYPWIVLADVRHALWQISRLRRHDIRPIPRYVRMGRGDKTVYALWFLALIGAHVGAIWHLGSVAGAGLAAELLR